VSSRVARGIFGGASVAVGGAALAIMPYVSGISAKIALTTIGVALPSVIYVIGNAVVSEIAPVAQRGALLAIGTAVSTSAGLLAPYVMGSVVETAATPLNGFNTGFMICGVAARRRAHVLGVERVLEREHDAVHRHLIERGVAAVLRIEFGGAFERIGIVAKHLADRWCAGGSGPKATEAVSRIEKSQKASAMANHAFHAHNATLRSPARRGQPG
jgi:MFS family permease